MSALSLELDKDRRTVSAALSDVAPDGKRNGFPAWHLLTALRALGWVNGGTVSFSLGDLNPGYERARKDKELADKTALQNEMLRGKLVDRELTVADHSVVMVNLKNNLLGVGNRVADVGMTAKSSGELEEIISDAIRDALNGLSEVEGVGSDFLEAFPEGNRSAE